MERSELIGIGDYQKELRKFTLNFMKYIDDGVKIAKNKPVKEIQFHYGNPDIIEEVLVKVSSQMFKEKVDKAIKQVSIFSESKVFTESMINTRSLIGPLLVSSPGPENEVFLYLKKYELSSQKLNGEIAWDYTEEEYWLNKKTFPIYYYNAADIGIGNNYALLVITLEDENFENGVDYFYKVTLLPAKKTIDEANLNLNDFLPQDMTSFDDDDKMNQPRVSPVIPLSPVTTAVLKAEGLVPRSEFIFLSPIECWNC